MSGTEERHKVRLAVYLIMRRGDQLLMIRRSNTGYMDGKLGLPSGHVEPHEAAEAAMVREAKEEVGITITPDDIQLAFTFHRAAEEGSFEYIDLYFEATTWQGEPVNAEPDKCSELLWADSDHLPGDVIPAVHTALTSVSRGMHYGSVNF